MKILRIALILASSTLILMGAAIFNGFPIVYADTSTYISSGFTFIPPFDRPITYCIFILITSLFGLSLWPVVFTQSFIVALLLYYLCMKFFPKKGFTFLFISLMVLLGIFSGLAYVSGQLIADIFTPLVILT